MMAYINGSQASSNNQRAHAGGANNCQSCTDRVELSAGPRLLQKVETAMAVEDPERSARINFLKEQVQNGTYQLDAEKVAQAMMTDLIKDLG